MGDGIVRKWAVVVNGDPDPFAVRHPENEQMAKASLNGQGYDVISIEPDAGSKGVEGAIEDIAQKADDDDQVVLYFTGHGNLKGGRASVVVGDEDFYAGVLSKLADKIKGETTVIMDSCYSGNFGQVLSRQARLRFIGLSGKGLTDACRPFAERFWKPDKEADDNNDGAISWQERFDWATDDSGTIEYSLATYFTGKDVKEPINVSFNEVEKIDEPQVLKERLERLEAGQYAVVMYSASWCSACQTQKPDFIRAAAGGKYHFIIVEDDNVSEKFGLTGDGIPEYRLYGKNLPKNGIELPRDAKNFQFLIPQYISGRDPLIAAKDWLEKGNTEEQISALDILFERKEYKYIEEILVRGHLSNEAKLVAAIKIVGMRNETNRTLWNLAQNILLDAIMDPTIPVQLRQRATICIDITALKGRDTLISTLVTSAAKLGGVNAVRAIPSILDSGITEPDEILALIEAVAKAYDRFSPCLLCSLPDALQGLKNVGIKNPDEISALIMSIVNGREYPSIALDALPSVLQGIKDTGVEKPDEILAFLASVAGAAGKHANRALSVLPSILNSGITELDKVVNFIASIRDVAGKYTDTALCILPSILDVGIKEPDRILTLITSVIDAAGKGATFALSALPDILNAGIKEPDKISELVTAILNNFSQPVLAFLRLPSVLRDIERPCSTEVIVATLKERFNQRRP